MNNVFVYLELEGANVADVSLELLTKGRKLANQLGCQLEAIAAGSGLEGIEKQVLPFGVDKLHVFDAPGLFPYTSLPHTSILVNLFNAEETRGPRSRPITVAPIKQICGCSSLNKFTRTEV